MTGGALERRKAGVHLLIVKVPVSVVRRIDARIKGDRQPWLADLITRASKVAKPLGKPKPAKKRATKAKAKAKPAQATNGAVTVTPAA